MSEQRIALVKELFTASVSELTNAQNSFNALDTKAQNTTTIAGIFLASTLAFLNSKVFETVINSGKAVSLILLGFVTGFLIISVLCCLRSITIRETPVLKLTNFQKELEGILRQPDDQVADRYENFLKSRISDWITAASELRETNIGKAAKIFWGQIFLTLSIISIAILMIYTLAINYQTINPTRS